MASVYSITTEGVEALGTLVETVVQLRGATTVKAKVIEWGISFDGVTASAVPAVVRVVRQAADGTASAATEVLWDTDAPAANCAGYHSFTGEPSAGTALATYHVHPQGGALIVQYPPGREIVLDNATTSCIGIDVTSPAAVNVVGYLVFEE